MSGFQFSVSSYCCRFDLSYYRLFWWFLAVEMRKNNGTIATFEYDGLGRRIETVDATGGTTKRYTYDDQRAAVQTRAGRVPTETHFEPFAEMIIRKSNQRHRASQHPQAAHECATPCRSLRSWPGLLCLQGRPVVYFSLGEDITTGAIRVQ
jgi:YD repeat-containing protein